MNLKNKKINTIRMILLDILTLVLGIISIMIFLYFSLATMFICGNKLGAFISLKYFDIEKIILFSGIGIIIILLVFIWKLIKKALSKRTQLINLILNLLIPLAMLYFILILSGLSGSSWTKSFTKGKWNAYEYAREFSIKDFHHKYKIIGMDKKQVYELLGSNNMYIKNENGYEVYYYLIGQNLTANYYFRVYMKNNIVVNFDDYTT